MMQSTLQHVAVVMDGNGRWAQARGWPRVAGHRAGAEAVRRTVEAARRAGLPVLTLYAFSSDNWQRPEHEVSTLMSLFARYLDEESLRCAESSVRINVIGRRDRLASALLKSIDAAEQATASCSGLLLRIAVDYSARDAIVRAAESCNGSGVDRERFRTLLASATASATSAPDVDLLIRTGGEQRLSDFMLWEAAYAELYFTPTMWPDFGEEEFDLALAEFSRRQRRFGRIPA